MSRHGLGRQVVGSAEKRGSYTTLPYSRYSGSTTVCPTCIGLREIDCRVLWPCRKDSAQRSALRTLLAPFRLHRRINYESDGGSQAFGLIDTRCLGPRQKRDQCPGSV